MTYWDIVCLRADYLLAEQVNSANNIVLHTPMAEIRWYDEEIVRICKVSAKHISIILLFFWTEGTNKDRYNTKFSTATEKEI